MELKYYFENVQCKKCSLWETSEAKDYQKRLYRRSGIFGKGTGKNGLLIIGDNITLTDILTGTNFSGQGGILLNDLLIKTGIIPSESYLTTLLRCKCPGNRKPKIDEIRFCQSENMAIDLPNKDWRPNLILMLGNAVLQTFTKEQKITERRGQFFNIDFIDKSVPAIVTYHPNVVLYTPKLVSTIELDIKKCSDFIRGIRYDYLPNHERIFVDSKETFISNLDKFICLDSNTIFSVDIESTGLDRYNDEIISMSITYKHNDEDKYTSLVFLTVKRDIDEGFYFVDLKDKNCEEFILLKYFLENRNLTFHNGDFDVYFIWNYDINCRYTYDTIDAHLLLEEEDIHKLKYLVKKYIAAGAGYEKTIQDEVENNPGNYKNADREILFNYNSDDSFFTLMLLNIFIEELKKQNVYDFYINHAMPLRRTMTKISFRGILIDKNKLTELADNYRKEIEEKNIELIKFAGKEFNESSVDQIREILFTDLKLPVLKKTEKDFASTDKTVLEELARLHPFPKLLIEVRHLKKMCSTYLDGKTGTKELEDEGNGILKYIDKNNRIHSSFLTHGTNSGRLSSRNPNCFSLDTEILTRQGWKKYYEINYETEIASFDGRKIIWENPISIYVSDYSYKNMVMIKNQHIDICLTDNHRTLTYDRKTHKERIREAKNFPKDGYILHGYKSEFSGVNIEDDWLRLLIAIQADGSFTNGNQIELSFNKIRKYNRILYLLNNLKLSFVDSKIDSRNRYRIRINNIKNIVVNILGINKTFPIEWLNLSNEQRNVFFEELWQWDGCSTRKNNYSSNNEQNVDFVQALAALHGFRAHKRIYKNKLSENNNYQLDIIKRNYSLISNAEITTFNSNKKVWCLKVPSDRVLIRKGSDTLLIFQCQNIPKDANIRNIFIAPPGWKLIEVDLKTAELVILAYLTGDKNLIKSVNERDLHADVARNLLGISSEEKVDDKTRTIAKRINFRKAYGGGPKGLYEQLGITLQEATQWFDRWDNSFPDVGKWNKKQYELWKQQGYIESVFGRRKRFQEFRYLYSIDRDAYNARQAYYDRISINHPCQSAVGDVTNRAIYLFEQALDQIFGEWYPDERIYKRPGVVLTVHDSIIVECPNEMVSDMADLLQTCLALPVPKLNISLKSDVKISDCWMQEEEN